MWPDRRYDVDGVYSGNTFIDDDGFPCALYTGNVAAMPKPTACWRAAPTAG